MLQGETPIFSKMILKLGARSTLTSVHRHIADDPWEPALTDSKPLGCLARLRGRAPLRTTT
mgnify:FL=1|jgi:hypothetical protein